MKKILILGVNSYIGTSFHYYLTTQYPGEYDVECISLRGDAWRKADWSGYDSVINVTGKAHADISNLSEAQKREYYTVNCDLACEAARKAIEDGAGQYIYFSSIIVYGDSSNSRKPVQITAETKPHPSNFYGDSKWQAEQRLQELFADKGTTNRTNLAILRPPMIYGKDSKGNFSMLKKLAGKTLIFPAYPNRRSMLYVENLAEFLRLLADSGEGGLFFPQEKNYISTAEMVSAIAVAEGKKLKLCKWMNPLVRLTFHAPGKVGKIALKAFGSLIINEKMSTFTEDYRKVRFEEGIRRSI